MQASPGDGQGEKEEDLDSWLNSDEANFFSTRTGESLDYAEDNDQEAKRDIFPILIGVIVAIFVVVGGLYYLLKPAEPGPAGIQIADQQPASADKVVDQSAKKPLPVIIAEDDEIKIQSPHEAARELAMGTLSEQGKTVLQPNAQPVTVLRDVEDLGAAGAEKAVSDAQAHVAAEPLPATASEQKAKVDQQPQKQAETHENMPAAEAVAQKSADLQKTRAEQNTADHNKAVVQQHQAAQPKTASAGQVGQKPAASEKTFAQLYAEGTRLLQREKYKPALAIFEKALRKDPGDARVHRSIGQIYYEYGNLKKAMTQYRRALALSPRDAKSHLLMGLVLQEKGDLVAARKHYEQYLDLAPDGSEASAVRGILKTLPAGP